LKVQQRQVLLEQVVALQVQGLLALQQLEVRPLVQQRLVLRLQRVRLQELVQQRVLQVV
jgi:hypothetical protein